MATNVSCILVTSKIESSFLNKLDGIFENFTNGNSQKKISNVTFTLGEFKKRNLSGKAKLLIVNSDSSQINIATRKASKKSSLSTTFFNTGFKKFASNKLQGLFSVGTAAIAATTFFELSDNFLQSLESIPFLSEFELFVGLLVTTNFAFKFFGNAEERIRIESWLESVRDKIFGTNELDLVLDTEPSMLDVQIRSLVNECMKNDDENENNSLNSKKKELVDTLKGFILNREIQSRKINSLLRTDLEKYKNNVDSKNIQDELISLRSVIALKEEKLSSILEANNKLMDENENEKEKMEEMNAILEDLNSKIEKELKSKEEMSLKSMELENEYEKVVQENKLWSERFSSFEKEVKEKHGRLEMEKKEMEAKLENEIKRRREESANLMWIEAQMEAMRADKDEKDDVIFSLQTSLENSVLDNSLLVSEISVLNEKLTNKNRKSNPGPISEPPNAVPQPKITLSEISEPTNLVSEPKTSPSPTSEPSEANSPIQTQPALTTEPETVLSVMNPEPQVQARSLFSVEPMKNDNEAKKGEEMKKERKDEREEKEEGEGEEERKLKMKVTKKEVDEDVNDDAETKPNLVDKDLKVRFGKTKLDELKFKLFFLLHFLDIVEAYAKSISEIYIDPKKTFFQQTKAMDLFIAALVEKGANEEWAKSYVKNVHQYERSKAKKRKMFKKSPPSSS